MSRKKKCIGCGQRMDADKLTDGRCGICHKVHLAKAGGMSYGMIQASLPREEIKPVTIAQAEIEIPDDAPRCKICGKAFISSWPGRVTCGDADCVYENARRNANEWQRNHKQGTSKKAICKKCGKEFTVSRARKSLCSDECREAWRKERKERINRLQNASTPIE